MTDLAAPRHAKIAKKSLFFSHALYFSGHFAPLYRQGIDTPLEAVQPSGPLATENQNAAFPLSQPKAELTLSRIIRTMWWVIGSTLYLLLLLAGLAFLKGAKVPEESLASQLLTHENGEVRNGLESGARISGAQRSA